MRRGAEIYTSQCASCHGDHGQGVPKAYAQPLIGDDSIGELTKIIHDTMPEGEPEKCVGEDAAAVASYIHYSFYSEAAQVRNRPPKAVLQHLTAEQLRQSIADLYAQFESWPYPSDKFGLSARYYDGDRHKKENLKIERVDPTIQFDFDRSSPGEGIAAESFAISWSGGLKPPQSGLYEIIVRSTCSFQLFLGKGDRIFIDNHVQSGDKTEFRQFVHLTAGRVYPLRLEFIQRKRKTELPPARISLSWVPSGGTEQIIPTNCLISTWVPPTYALQAALPDDDRSYGFKRGLAMDRQWDESTTAAALEFAQIASEELWQAYRRAHKNDPNEDRKQLKQFLTQIVESAFRSPLDEETRGLFIDRQVASTEDDAEAIKRVVLLSLKSPRFLYPTARLSENRSQIVANQLALVLFDSLPNEPQLRQAVQEGRFENEEQVRQYAREKVNDYRVRAKTMEFLYEWLNLSQRSEITKNAELFPGYDAQITQDLRGSLDAFLEAVVWGPDSDYRQLFNSDWTYTTDRLTAFYGDFWKPVEGETSQTFKKTVADPEHRFGVLTHPYVLSRFAYTDNSSPIHRGIFLIRYMLGRTLRPPADAFAPLSPDLHPDLTTRERVHLQTSPESCQMCHSKINGLGFVLENYDAVGRYRTTERGKAIDASGQYSPRAGDQVKFTGPADLARYLINSEEAQQAFVNRAFLHFVKQPTAAYGSETTEKLTAKFRASNFNIRELIVEIGVVAALK